VELADIAIRDLKGFEPLQAIAHVAGPKSSASQPASFICLDGQTYWLKGTLGVSKPNGFGGLVAELIAGRLADKIGAGPEARVVNVPNEALPAGHNCNHLVGLCVGHREVKAAVSSKEDIDPMLATGAFDPGKVDPESRARVIALHTWLGSQDGDQVLVSMIDGTVSGVDYAAAFRNLAPQDPVLTVGRIDNVAADACKAADVIGPAIAAVAAVSDDLLLDIAAGMPVIDNDIWQSSVENRLQIVEWLSQRRAKVEEVLIAWART
jgi:hypothetical protein